MTLANGNSSDLPADRSRRIVEAAYALLQEEGLEGLTIRAVLQRTGLSRRAFYERFAGKDDLVLAVFAEILRLAAEQYGEQVRLLRQPLDQLELIITRIALGKRGEDQELVDSRHGAAMSREHMRLAESRPDELQQALHPLLELIARVLADGMACGVVRRADPRRLAALVYNLVSTTMHTELIAQASGVADMAQRSQLAADLWEFCRRAVIT